MRKKLLSAILCVVMVGMMVMGCSDSSEEKNGEESKSEETYKIGFVLTDLTDPFFAAVQEGAVAYCEKMGYDVTILDGKSDTETMISANENLIASGCDMIFTNSLDAESMEGVVADAVAAGIYVDAMPAAIEGCDSAIVYDDYEFGYKLGVAAGEWINDHFGGETDYAILTMPTSESLNQRETGIIDGIKSVAPDANHAISVAAYTQDAGVDAAENILQQYPDVYKRQIIGRGSTFILAETPPYTLRIVPRSISSFKSLRMVFVDT